MEDGAGWRAPAAPGQPRFPSRDPGLVPGAGVLPAPSHPPPLASVSPSARGSQPSLGLSVVVWGLPGAGEPPGGLPVVGGEGHGCAGEGLSSTPSRDALPSRSLSLDLTTGGQARPQAVQGADSSCGPSPFPSGENCWGGETKTQGWRVARKGPEACGRANLAGCPACHEAG